ncbi:hypothetical protein FGG08_004575 [Glutinoglossum americanum]|uniref:Uncharacterized protein n=1 Tax=Glutinoglossum americanum TaxID=1670608 RepID=A0A9P8KZE6_9PEZI|nr:hypothetical protein FGG08_004575 [Glutinoglossum americanum]
MQPPNLDVLGLTGERERSSSFGRASHMAGSAGRSASDVPRFPRSDESWIEIASQPSSSSLSSAATDEIVTTGLYVQQHDPNARRRRRAHHPTPRGAHFSLQARSSAGSSQEEYEDSESDEDRVMTSSNENVRLSSRSNFAGRTSQKPYDSDSGLDDDDDDDGDENSTALGVGNNHHGLFTPQPNVFSHPPSSQSNSRNHVSDPYSSRHASSSRNQRSQPPLHSSRRTHSSHIPYNIVSPSYRADHDAALRASLSTLLSCAAAARGLPKQSQSPPRRRGSAGGPTATTIEPGTLRIVSESVVMGEGRPDKNDNESGNGPDLATGRMKSRRSSTASTSSNASGDASPSPNPHPDKGKRKPTTTAATNPNPPGHTTKPHHRIAKKPRAKPPSATTTTTTNNNNNNSATPEITLISPTLLTWVVSAGVVVLVSAISFSAGYAIGREVGRGEAAGFLGAGAGAGAGELGPDGECGREVVRGGLRRLRWSAGTGMAGA